MVRLVVRLEGYCLFVLKHAGWFESLTGEGGGAGGSSRTGAGVASYARGLEPGRDCDPAALARVADAAVLLRCELPFSITRVD